MRWTCAKQILQEEKLKNTSLRKIRLFDKQQMRIGWRVDDHKKSCQLSWLMCIFNGNINKSLEYKNKTL